MSAERSILTWLNKTGRKTYTISDAMAATGFGYETTSRACRRVSAYIGGHRVYNDKGIVTYRLGNRVSKQDTNTTFNHA